MKKVTIPEIISQIDKQQEKILKNITAESVAVYLFLKNEYKKGNIKNNTVFQFVFRSYYRLDNAGLSTEFKNKYFELLADKKDDLKNILIALYDFPTLRNLKTIQFSFATKLLHTLNNSNPIFDSEIASVIHERVIGDNKTTRIESCVEIYNTLSKIYFELIKDKKIRKVLSKVRLKFNISTKKMADIKVLDFIIWSLGKLKKIDHIFI